MAGKMAGSYRFPEDLGTDQNGHYVSFNAYKSTATTRVLDNINSATQGIAGSVATSMINQANDWFGTNYQAPTNYNQSQGTVFMYVPGGGQSALQWDQEHTYTDVKLARLATNATIGVTDALETGAQLAGYAINPRIEVLYQTTKLRTFEFMFMMAPQSEYESQQMEAIINFFRAKAAPTLGTSTLVFEAPHEWVVQFGFKSGGAWQVNPHVPKLGRSILNRVNVSYPAPGAEYSTFTNGYPVSALLQMRFVEMSIIDSNKIGDGY